MTRTRYGVWGAGLLLLVMLTELTLSIKGQSLSWDEGDHIFAGYMSWKTGDYGLNPEHPPLVKALATLPMLGMDLQVPKPNGLPYFKDEAYFDGRDLLFDHGEAQADRIIFRVRMMAALFSLLLALLVFLWAREMFGEAAGLFAMALVVFEPNLIAHGAYVTTDMGVSCLMLASMYALYRYVQAPGWGRLVVVGLATGLALAAKHSAVLLLPMALVLLVTEMVWPPAAWRGRRGAYAGRLAGAFVLASAVALVVLWATYHFRFAMRPGGVAMVPSLVEYTKGLSGGEARVYLALARWHVLPESYLFGLTDVRLVSNSFPSYLFGKVYAHGVPLYFPAAFVIKSTLGFMALMLLAGYAAARGWVAGRREILFMMVPPLIYLAVAIQSGLNIGARHILPLYGFLAVLIGGAVVALTRRDRRWGYAAGVLLAWHVVSSARSYPVYLAYSNELWGGPDNTYKYLTDSNTDWGQQLKGVKKYLDARGVKQCWFAYFVEPEIHPSAYGIPCRMLPSQDTIWGHEQVDTPETITGPVLISMGTLTGYEFGSNVLNPYRHFQALRPAAVIDHGVFVYDGTFDMRFAAALGHVTRATELTKAKQLEVALQEARTAVAIDPDEMQAEMMLGDTLVALGRGAEARPVYARALGIAKTMEPSAAQEWVPQVEEKMRKL